MLHNPIRTAALAAALLLSASADAKASPPAQEVQALVAQLDNPRFAARRLAEESIRELGVAALGPVERALRDAEASVEARARLARVAADLRADAFAEPRRVTLDLADAPAADVLAALADQAGLTLRVAADLAPARIDARYQNTPALAAIADLCARHDWDIATSARGALKLDVEIVNADARRQLAGPTQAAGPLLLSLRGGELTRSVRHAGANNVATRQTELSVHFAAHIEPRFQIGPREIEIEWTRIADAAGRSLMPGDAPSEMVADLGAMAGGFAETPVAPAARPSGTEDDLVTHTQWSAGHALVSLELPLPDGLTPAEGPLSIAGRFRTLVGGDLADREAILTPHGNAALRWSVAGEPVTVRLKSLPRRPGDDDGEERFGACFEILRALPPSHERLVLASLGGCELSRDGRALRRATTRTRTGTSGGVEYLVEFVDRGDAGDAQSPLRLTATLAQRAVWLEVPFAFDNVPNPLD